MIEFINTLSGIVELTRKKEIYPVIHIEAHGYKGKNEEGGLKLEPSGEYLECPENKNRFVETVQKMQRVIDGFF